MKIITEALIEINFTLFYSLSIFQLCVYSTARNDLDKICCVEVQ